MSHTYRQSTGEWFGPGGELLALGYSGSADGGKNLPALESVPEVGPLPRGAWEICGPPQDTATHGPYVLRLAQKTGESFGRSGFLIHGDSISSPGSASHGCIVLPYRYRLAIWESGDRSLLVVE